jgi:hypothetical protein
MANTTTVLGRAVQNTGLDADSIWSTDLPKFLQDASLSSLIFKLSRASDVLVIRKGMTTEPRVFDRDNVAANECVGKFGPGSGINPVIKITDCTFSVAANAVVILHFG